MKLNTKDTKDTKDTRTCRSESRKVDTTSSIGSNEMNRRTFIAGTTAAAAGLFLAWPGIRAQAVKGVPGTTVETTAGKIRGLVIDKIHAFKGVPYGASTTGARRFLPPVNVQPWTGVREAFEIGLRAPLVDSVL